MLVDGRALGHCLRAADPTEFRREDEKRLVRFAQLASVANADAHEALATQARTDPPTGLANRRAFDERLADCADQALYGAKDQGRNQVVSYDADMPSRSGLRLSA